ncbi:MAG TPA: AsmA family protein, partial [Rhizobiales bacterium]|nr:AsmA family protein [Hyphomicrobiales bacterium]
MSAWRSPLLLFGIAIILLAGGALVAPYFIDWGNYRSDFEKYGREITGRETRVAGDISVRLFPWPRMTVRDVRVANPAGAKLPELFRADEIDIRLRLAPLLSGKLEVEAININRPVIGLERLASGQGSWKLEPTGNLTGVFGAEDVEVSAISVTNGTIVLADGQRGGEAQLDGFNAFITARSLNGPWKLRGEAIVQDQGISISLNTGKWHEGQPLKFGIRLAPLEGSGLTYSFDGQSSDGKRQEISGKLKIEPTVSRKGKSDAQENFRPVVFRSIVKADFDQIRFSKIEVAPKNAVDVRTFVTGEAVVKLGSILKIDANLKAARFDVDSVLGNKGRKTLRSMQSLDAVAGFVEGLPQNIHLHTVVDLTTLVLAGETLDGASVDLDVVESRLKINSLTVALPGQTKAAFQGSLLVGSKGEKAKQPQLIGDLKLDMVSLKDFVKWA